MLNVLFGIPQGIKVNVDTDNLEYCNFVYMCIKEPNSYYHIPDNILGLLEPILNTIWNNYVSSEQSRKQYCYVTIKKMYIQPNTFGNREGWHGELQGGCKINPFAQTGELT